MAGLTKKMIHFLLLVALGGVFAYAGILKALDPAAFALDVDHYHMLPWQAAALLALYLPWLEIVCAVTLLFNKFRAAALWLILGMTLVFLAALVSAVARGLDISCGCFGGGSGHPAAAIARDLAILAAIIVCQVLEKKRTGKKPTGYSVP